MINSLTQYLLTQGITLHGVLPLAECHLLRPYLLTRAGFDEQTLKNTSVLLFAVPYLTKEA